MNNRVEVAEFIFNCAKDNFSILEISNYLEISEKDFKALLNNYEDLKSAFDRGVSESKKECIKLIKNQAFKGKPKALEKYINIVDNNKLSNLPVIETREQKYIRMRAIRLMHYFQNIGPEVLNYIVKQNDYDEFMEKLDWAYKNDKMP